MDVFHTLAEVAVAITGFSSLIFIFRGNSSEWTHQDYVSLGFILSWSIGCVFLSLMPIVMVEFGIDLASAAQIGLFSAALYMLIVGALLTYTELRIIKLSETPIKSRTNIWMSLLFTLIVVSAILSALSILPGPQHAWYAATIVMLMIHATAEMGIFVVRTTLPSR